MPALDPTTIVVPPNRQRSKLDTKDLEASIATLGQIQDIVVRRDGETVLLVVGGRRLQSCINLGIPVQARFWDELSPLESREIELEENIKRSDLPWRDQIRAYGDLHAMRKAADPTWTTAKTAARLNYERSFVARLLIIYRNLDSPLLAAATGIEHARSILERAAERKTADIVDKIAAAGERIFGGKSDATTATASASASAQASATVPAPGDSETTTPLGGALDSGTELPKLDSTVPSVVAPIICGDFLKWAPAYTGAKFNLIHCDFPYGIQVFAGTGMNAGAGFGIDYDDSDAEIYWRLVDCLCTNLDRIASYSAHLLFWFSMNYYERTRKKLESAGLMVQAHPLIWLKSDGKGIIPGRSGEYPRRVYETAFLCSRGNRPLGKQLENAYASPSESNPLQPTQKSESMLKHFLAMLIDGTTDVLDPTCGSGSALRAAEHLGARSILGLELNPEFAKAAATATAQARIKRKASGGIQ